MSMSAFTDAEIEYLNSQGLGSIATVGADGMPHVIPVGVFYDPQTQAVVIGSNAELAGMAATKKFRDAQRRPKVAVVVDDRPAMHEQPSAPPLPVMADSPPDSGDPTTRREALDHRH
jgi:PPOX class F420-dependent enzyme/OxyR family protein